MDPRQIQQILNSLVSNNVYRKQKAIMKLPKIAKAIGDQLTRNELVPFITKELVYDENNFIVISLSTVIPKMIKYLGGSQYISLLFPILEFLAKNPEQEVREKVTNNLKILLDKLNFIKTEVFCSNLLNRFYSSDIYISNDIFCDLMCHVYPLASQSYQNSLIQQYLEILNHPDILLRKFGVMHLQKLSRIISTEHEDDLIRCIHKLSQDNVDYIRALIPPCIVRISNPEKIKRHQDNVLTLIKRFGQDQSYRVRIIFINYLPQIASSLSSEIVNKIILPLIFQFINDEEPEIRIAILQNLYNLCFTFQEDEVIKVLEMLKDMINEKNIDIKQALSKQLTGFSVFLDNEQVLQYIIPLFMKLSKGKNPEIRINLFANIKYLLDKIEMDEEFQQYLMQIVIQLVKNKNWRVRIQIMDHLPQLYKFIPDQNNKKFIQQVLINFSTDQVHSVRDNTPKIMKQMCLILGDKKFEEEILQSLLNLQYSKNYLHRIVLLKIISTLDNDISLEFNKKNIQKLIQNLLKDKVSNVRLNLVSIILKNIRNRTEQQNYYNYLNELQQDPDPEIQKRIQVNSKN